MMALHKVNHMNEADHQIVSDAVSAAEAHTNGEIVTIVTDYSDHYGDVASLWASIAAFASLSAMALFPKFYLGLLDWASGGWQYDYTPGQYLGFILVIMAIKWIAMRLIMNWMPLRVLLTSKGLKQRRVRQRAIDLFKVSAQGRTVASTGILIYLSMREHRAEIVADAAIAAKVAPEIWGDAMIALITHVRAGRAGAGMAEAVAQVGIVLAEHFPKGNDAVNELPDRLIEL
jgi:putative membrane protein